MDEVGLYNRALSDAEVAAIYTAGQAGKCMLPTPPVVIQQPQSRIVPAGTDVWFSTSVSGARPMRYQWLLNTAAISDGTNGTLVVWGAGSSNAGNYSLIVSNDYGSATSTVATLAIAVAPTITTQPQGYAVEAGASVTLTSAAEGLPSPAYQWYRNGVLISGATDPALIITEATALDAGTYTLQATNIVGSVISSPAILTVRTLGLAEALDTGHELTWTTLPEGTWFGQTNVSQDQVDAAQAGPSPAGINPSLTTTISGPGLLLFWWKVNGGNLLFFLDDQQRAIVSDNTDWRQRQLVIPPGIHTLNWMSFDEYSAHKGWVDRVQYSPGVTTPVTLPMDQEIFPTGYPDWFEQTRFTHDHVSAAQSGNIGGGDSSSAFLQITGPGTLSFWWAVSSEAQFDRLALQLDGVELTNISGVTGWRQRVLVVPDGDHSVSWTYAKDVSVSKGFDAGWIDEVTFTPDPPPRILRQPASRTVFEGDDVVFEVVASGVTPFSCEWRFNDSPSFDYSSPDIAGTTIKLSNVIFDQGGEYRVIVRNGAGEAWSLPFRLVVKPRIEPQIVFRGATASLRLQAGGLRAKSYQWSFNGNPLEKSSRLIGLNRNALHIFNAQPEDSGYYDVLVRNAEGTEQSFQGYLQVLPRGCVLVHSANSYGEADVPAALSDVTAVAASETHLLALKADGTVAAWGSGWFGQTTVPADLSNVVTVTSGFYGSMALKLDGTLRLWGAPLGAPQVPPVGVSDLIAISTSGNRNLGLHRDGTVISWNWYAPDLEPSPVGLSNVIAVAAGAGHSLALKADGTVVAWGSNDSGQTNVPTGLSDVTAIAAGNAHSVALRRNGTVVVWGTQGAYPNHPTAGSAPSGLANVTAIVAGNAHTVALTRAGKVIIWGATQNGTWIVRPVGLPRVSALAASDYTDAFVVSMPVIVTDPISQTTSAGSEVTFSVATVGREPISYQWRFNGHNIAGATNSSLALLQTQLSDSGNFSVLIKNAFGSALSANARLAVTNP